LINNIFNEVVGLGTCNIDFITEVPRFVKADDEVDVENLTTSLGGSASNFTVAVSRLDIKTGIIARIGNDYFGKWSYNAFKKEGIDTKRLIRLDELTGMVFIAVDPVGERSMYTFMGANAQFHLEKEDIQYIKGSKVLHVTGMYKEVVEEASRHANFLSLDPGTILSSYGMGDLDKIIHRTNIIFLNRKEAAILTGMDFDGGASMLVDMGVPMVVVTLGRDGASLYTEEGVIHSSARKVKVLDTTGAGDAFAAGFIASYINGRKYEYCMDFANLVASYSVQRVGAMTTPKISGLDL
jgi:alpha-D-ribose-1-phosphate 5-kinase (ATP)